MRHSLPSVSDKHSLSEIRRKEKSVEKGIRQNDGGQSSCNERQCG